MPRPPKEQSAAADRAIVLSELVAGIAQAILAAKVRLDQDGAAIAEQYKASAALSVLPPPSFAIGEVRVGIKFAIVRMEHMPSTPTGTERGPAQVHVYVTAESLAEIAPHLVSEMELRISPEVKRVQPVEISGDSPE
jgi:hypothetical protein